MLRLFRYTSLPYGISKSAVLINMNFHEDVGQAGEDILATLYNVKELGLNMGRAAKFCNTIASAKKYVKSEQPLPHTSNAARLHPFRVYHQCPSKEG